MSHGRKIAEFEGKTQDGRRMVVRVYRVAIWDEYQAREWVARDAAHSWQLDANPAVTYHTSDKSDALATARSMAGLGAVS